MKIPKARKLPSGKWCVQLRIDGRSITITRDKEEQAIAEALAVKKGIVKAKAAKPKKKVTEAIDDYISCRSNVLSPATVRGYRFIQRGRFQTMMQRDIGAVTQEQWQRALETLSNRQRQTILLWKEGYNQEEIGKLLGITQSAVSEHFAHAVQKLKEYYSR